VKNILVGILFAILWSSASVATKFAVLSVSPLITANIRFFIAGILLLSCSYLFFKNDRSFRLPDRKELKQLSVFGLLNTTVYLGFYVYAMKYTAAGIGSLAVSTNPLMIAILSAWLIKRSPSGAEWTGIILSMLGVSLAVYPLLQQSYTSFGGLVLLMLSMISISYASVYYAGIKWTLPDLLINGWQVFLGGIFLLPFTLFIADFQASDFDARFWISVLWLSLGVSICGLICWFYLLRIDAIKASLWLFLCPIFGFLYAWLLMDEPVTWYTVAGTLLVLGGLYLGQRYKSKVVRLS
jgi:drug/metabolite transporter (DMT)-like permease